MSLYYGRTRVRHVEMGMILIILTNLKQEKIINPLLDNVKIFLYKRRS